MCSFRQNAFYRLKKKKVCKRVLTSPGINHISLSLPAALLIEQKDGLLTSSSGRVQRHCGRLDAEWHAVFPGVAVFNHFISTHFFLRLLCISIFYFPLSVWKLRDSSKFCYTCTMTKKRSWILITTSRLNEPWTPRKARIIALLPRNPHSEKKKARESSVRARRLRSLQPRN